jgi:hypothetical protein
MADSLKFTIGGQLGPSYRGALAQAEVEALRANQVMRTKIRAQEARIAALDKTYNTMGPLGSAEALAVSTQAYSKRMAMEKNLHLMQLKNNLSAGVSARRLAAEQIAAQEAVTSAMLSSIAAGGGAGIASGGHGGGGMSGIIRESMTVVRELAMGRTKRAVGSVTLLAQYMGLLGKVVKSTASEQLVASAAASKLSQAMAAEALAAKGTAAFAELSAAALAQETVATQAATEAQIALQTAKVTLNPLAWVLIGGVVIAGILAGIAMHMHTLAKRAQNLADMMNPLKKKFTEMADAMRDNAKEHQEYLDWLRKVGSETESLPERIDKVIRKMREQAQAEMELARMKGRSRVELERMEEAQLKAELNIVTLGKLQAQREAEDARVKADADEAALQAFDPATARSAKDVSNKAGNILDAVQEAMNNSGVTSHASASGGVEWRKDNESEPQTVKVNGKEITTSVTAARAAYDKTTKESERLAAIQKELHDVLANDKTTVEEKTKSVKQLTDEQQKILDELGIKQTTGREIAKLSGSRGRIAQGEMEKAGLFQSGAQVRIHDTLIDTLKEVKKIEHNTQRGNGGHAKNGVNFG